MSSGIQQIPPTCSMLHWYEVCELSSTVWYIISDELNKGQVSSLIMWPCFCLYQSLHAETLYLVQKEKDSWNMIIGNSHQSWIAFIQTVWGFLHPQWLQEILRILRPARTSF